MEGMKHEKSAHYRQLLLMAGLHFAAMFILMYAMVNTVQDAVPNLNQVYMAALMTAPMLIIELLLMGSMYGDKSRNLIILAAAATVLVGAFVFIRQRGRSARSTGCEPNLGKCDSVFESEGRGRSPAYQ
jgi:hypothetical protein